MPSSPMNGVLPPFELPSNVVLFHDWRYVDHGYLRWLDDENQPANLMPPPDPLPPIHADWEWIPRGIRLEAMPAQIDAEPVLTAAQLDEKIFFGGSVLFEQGRYRLFYGSFPPDAFSGDDKCKHAGHHLQLRHATSDDGLNWKWDKDNIVFDGGETGFHGGCVFVDTSSQEGRYKAVFLGMLTQEQLDHYREKYPADIDPMAAAAGEWAKPMAALGLFGATSPDGLRWSKVEEPLLVQHSDTFHAATYDAARKKYVIYLRSWFYGRRTVGRTESDDFAHFPAPDQILWPDGGMAPCDLWYTPGYNVMPGAPDYHLLFPTRWSQLDDGFTPHLFSSPDGLAWSRVSGEVLPPWEMRPAWCRNGCAMGSLVPLPGRRIGSLITALHVPHKHPRVMPYGYAGWAWWPEDRLVALRAERDGCFALWPLRTGSRKIVLNFRAKIAGAIRVEVGGVKGRSFADCDVLCGDETGRVVTWNGQSDLGHDGDVEQIKFEMNNADLFSVRFE